MRLLLGAIRDAPRSRTTANNGCQSRNYVFCDFPALCAHWLPTAVYSWQQDSRQVDSNILLKSRSHQPFPLFLANIFMELQIVTLNPNLDDFALNETSGDQDVGFGVDSTASKPRWFASSKLSDRIFSV
jgi:hypothetical protein